MAKKKKPKYQSITKTRAREILEVKRSANREQIEKAFLQKLEALKKDAHDGKIETLDKVGSKTAQIVAAACMLLSPEEVDKVTTQYTTKKDEIKPGEFGPAEKSEEKIDKKNLKIADLYDMFGYRLQKMESLIEALSSKLSEQPNLIRRVKTKSPDGFVTEEEIFSKPAQMIYKP